MPSTAAAIRNDHEAHGIPITSRRGNYRDHVVEQDHRAVKRGTHPIRGFTAFEATQCTLAGVEWAGLDGVVLDISHTGWDGTS
jgi:transposase-like protein